MKHLECASAVACLLVAAGAPPLWAQGSSQGSSGAVVMRTEDEATWAAEDDETGRFLVVGFDIVAACEGDPDAYDLADVRTVESPRALTDLIMARGEEVHASLWERAPSFESWAATCADILGGEPLAAGKVRLRVVAHVPNTWEDVSATRPVHVTAGGTLRTSDGEEIRVNAALRCLVQGGERRCKQSLRFR